MPLKRFKQWRLVRAVLLPVASVLAAFLVTGLLAWIAGADPLRAFYVIGEGAFGNLYVTGSTLVKATTLSLTGLAVGFAYRAGLLNIGAEGQLQMGAAAAAATAIYVPAPGPLLMILSVVAGFVAGAVWSGIAGVLRAAFKSNEIVTTLMLNYIALLIVGYLVTGPMVAKGATFRTSERIPASAELPILLPGTPVHAGLLIAIAAAVVIWFLLNRTTIGFVLQAMGHNPLAVRSMGWRVNRLIVVAMTISGGLAGLAGAGEVLGVHHRLLDGFSPGYGYLAIGVTFLASHNPFWTIVSGIFFGAGITGVSYLQRALQVPSSIMFVVQGLLIIFMATGAALTMRRKGVAQARVIEPLAEESFQVP
jgi:general nucleoside transport system permease protein